MAVVIKKDEKINATISMLTDNFSQQDFIDKFKELYPKDWAKLEKAYADHMRHAKLGKPVPMPEPEQYLKNALNVWKKQNKNQMKDNSDTIHILPIDNISEVGIDDKQRLYVRPEKQTFEYIYRAAAEVGWDNKEKFLFSPKPKSGHILIGIDKLLWRQKANMDVNLF